MIQTVHTSCSSSDLCSSWNMLVFKLHYRTQVPLQPQSSSTQIILQQLLPMGRELAPSHMINPISPMVTYFFKLNCSACAVNSRAALWTLTVMSHPCHTPNIHKVTFISEKINIFTYWFFSSSAKIESEKRSSEQNGASDPFQRLELIETPRCPQVE